MAKYCGSCGKEIADGMKFCPSCGKPISGIAEVTQPKKEPLKDQIAYLLKDKIVAFEHIKDTEQYNTLSESDVTGHFVEPLFTALGWDTQDINEYQRQKPISGGGFIDAVIKTDGKDAIIIEIKRFNGIHSRSSSLTDEIIELYEEEKQVLGYAKLLNAHYALLTNFEVFRVFDTFNKNKMILNIERPSQYLSPKNLENLIKFHKSKLFKPDDSPEPMTENTIPVEGNELTNLLNTFSNFGYGADEKNNILHILHLAYSIEGNSGLYDYYYKHDVRLPSTDPHPINKDVKNFLEYQDLVRFGGSSTSKTCGGWPHADVFSTAKLTEKGKPIGSQLVARSIENNKDSIINIINSMPAKALIVVLGYEPRSSCYPARQPEKNIPNPHLSDYYYKSIFSHVEMRFISEVEYTIDHDLPRAIDHLIKKNLYFIFTQYEKTWKLGDILYSNFCKMNLGYVVPNSSKNEVYAIPEELRNFVLDRVKCELDGEKRKILLASILAQMGQIPGQRNYEQVYRIIKETATENEIKEIVNSMATSGITTNYLYNPGMLPFFVKDSKRYYEFIDSNIITSVIESIMKK